MHTGMLGVIQRTWALVECEEIAVQVFVRGLDTFEGVSLVSRLPATPFFPSSGTPSRVVVFLYPLLLGSLWLLPLF